MTLEEEQRRRIRALHVRVTGLKDISNVEKEVTILTSMMGVEQPLHTRAWRVGKKSDGPGESSKERALILRFPSLEEKDKFLKKRLTDLLILLTSSVRTILVEHFFLQQRLLLVRLNCVRRSIDCAQSLKKQRKKEKGLKLRYIELH